jgi:hypothetical protein
MNLLACLYGRKFNLVAFLYFLFLTPDASFNRTVCVFPFLVVAYTQLTPL